MEIKGLIFDMDDTIVETEKHNTILIAEHFKNLFNLVLDDEDSTYVFGHSWQDIFDFLINKYNLNMDKFEIQKKFLLYKQEFLQNHKLRTATGVEKILRLPIPKVVVSGSGKDEISMVLDNIGFSSYFDKTFSVDEYKVGKPAPDGFLLALQYLDIPKENALIFEDSRSGLIAGKAAGIFTAFISEFVDDDWSEYADVTFSSFDCFYENNLHFCLNVDI